MKRYEKEKVMTHQCQDTNPGWVPLDVSCQMQRKIQKNIIMLHDVVCIFYTSILSLIATPTVHA